MSEKNQDLSPELRDFREQQADAGSFTGKNQHFSNIKNVFARDGFVFVQVKPAEQQETEMGNKLKDQMMSIRQAASRARNLNAMAHKLPEKDRKVAMDIVEAVIAACKEAKEQAEKIADGKASISESTVQDVSFDENGKPIW